MKRLASITLLLGCVVMLAGCPKKPKVVDHPNTPTQVPQGAQTGAAGGPSTTVTPMGDNGAASGGALGSDAAALARKIIYFDFDKSEIKPEYADIVAASARFLSSHPGVRVKLEGNTDERGTREYNIGLGERRAQAVRRALLLQGVTEAQVSTVSFGAERPAAEGDNEDAWAKNRRVEFVYQSATN
jgi:peptidoglycan-associated lipoprotein